MRIPAISVTEIASLVRGEIAGDERALVTGLAPIASAAAGDLSFIVQKRYLELLPTMSASAVFIDRSSPAPSDARPALIRVANPYFAFLQVIKKFHRPITAFLGIDPSARISASARLAADVAVGALTIIEAGAEVGEGVQIGPQCYIGHQACLGAGTILFANVHVAHEVIIGKSVIIQAGAVIGSDGFGYLKHEGKYHMIPHLGTVVIEDEVEIGANTCIDRGTFGETRIGRGAKLDNLVHVAHNVSIGENTVIAAQTGISGSATIGREVTIGGQVGFAGHIQIGDGTTFGAQAGVTKSIPSGITVSGYPAREHGKARKEEAALRFLPELLQRVRALEKALGVRRKSASELTRDDSEG